MDEQGEDEERKSVNIIHGMDDGAEEDSTAWDIMISS